MIEEAPIVLMDGVCLCIPPMTGGLGEGLWPSISIKVGLLGPRVWGDGEAVVCGETGAAWKSAKSSSSMIERKNTRV